ncbi:helix-turn-helix domain-containing protein [Pandoraea apista]|uniref:helix-turn-helix domain-containing protein n=1 Tax=Pandoraea apista TaxID=93218 RepID=UPI0026979174|nr:helix-turn-helix domain-containing protein [Pandoraea apista]
MHKHSLFAKFANCNEYFANMDSFGARLKEERKRIGGTQAEFGPRLGVSGQVQSRYERGDNHPDANYWAAAADIGVDVLYVLTGRRDVTEMSADEVDLVRRYRDASDVVKAAVLGALIGGAAPAKVQQNFHSGVNIGQQITGDVTAPQTFTFGSTKKKK